MHSFSGRASKRGFTLIELLISVGIIAIVTGIVLVKYTSFDSTVLLKGEAYEIALLLRESQVKSVSVVRSAEGEGFDYPYGMSFTEGSPMYQTFLFLSETAYPSYDVCSEGATADCASLLQEFGMLRSMQVVDLCVFEGDSTSNCNITRLDVSFRRPEFKALFNVPGSGVDEALVTKAQIILGSENESGGAGKFVVEVSKLGQISVFKQ